jgi:flagellar biosynthesis/type III secretory pathway protein FliH
MALKRLLAASALTLFAVPAAVAAQTIEWRPGPDVAPARYTDGAPISYYEFRRMAYDQGYREGTKEGENDARRGERFGYQDEKEFQRGDRGFHRNYGDRERYRELFRDGFAAGYSDGYARRAGYRGNGGWQGQNGRQGPYAQRGYGGYGDRYGRTPGRAYYTPAFDNGARDGYEKGQEDARKNRSHDVLRHSRYRSGDHDYRDEYGSKDEYRNIYRQGFSQGYDRGYAEGRYRW